MTLENKMHEKWWRSLSLAIKNAWGWKPTDVHSQRTLRTQYYWDALYRKAKGCFKVKAPKTWDVDYLLYHLLLDGYVAITDTAIGTIPIACQPKGVNYADLWTHVLVSNHTLGEFERTIDEDCVLLTMNGLVDAHGINGMLNIYANKLAECDASIEVNLINTKTPYIFGAGDKREAESLKLMYDDISKGKPAVFIRKEDIANKDTMYFQNQAGHNYIADKVQSEKRDIMEEFLTELGINNANTNKRERLNEAEVNSNNEELECNTAWWEYNIKEGVKKAKKMFGIELSITMPFVDRLREQPKDQLRTGATPGQTRNGIGSGTNGNR